VLRKDTSVFTWLE